MQRLPELLGVIPSAANLTSVLAGFEVPELFYDDLLCNGNPMALNDLVVGMGAPPLLAADLWQSPADRPLPDSAPAGDDIDMSEEIEV